jgi:hypothetical protein
VRGGAIPSDQPDAIRRLPTQPCGSPAPLNVQVPLAFLVGQGARELLFGGLDEVVEVEREIARDAKRDRLSGTAGLG